MQGMARKKLRICGQVSLDVVVDTLLGKIDGIKTKIATGLMDISVIIN